MKFSIRPSHWYKRRAPTVQKVVSRFEVDGVTLVDNSYCVIRMWYEDEPDMKELTGRVTQNDITKKFSINGINPYGDFLLLDVIEE